MADVLLVEDDNALAEGLTYALNLEKFTVTHVRTLCRAEEALAIQKYDVIILDVMLPDGSGLDFIIKIRQRLATPVLFLTACDQEYQVILGLDRGADDYITKPFRVRELISRIRVILRRAETAPAYRLVSGALTLDTQRTELYLNGRLLPLTHLEYKLLLFFMQHPRQTLTRAALLAGLWDNAGQFVDDNTLSVNIRRLREKIEEDSADPRYIVTVRGVGYLWDGEVRSV